MPIQISLSNAIGALQGLAGGGPGPGPGPGYTPPLDAFGGAVAAFSVRKLSSSYSGFCCQVTRTSDSATLDVPFTSSGLIDIDAINTFDDGGGVLLTTWYDQTSSGNDFSGGVGISTLEEKPGLNGSGVGLTNSGVTIPADFTLVTLNKYQNNAIYFGGSGNTFFNYAINGNNTNLRYRILGNTRDFVVNGRSGTEINVGTRTSGALQVRHQGNISTTPIAYNGSFPIDFLAKFNIYHQEYIIYNSSLTEPETLSLTQNINSYYQVTNLPDYTSGFLADYPDAAVAYSVRQLSNTAIKCMRVRRAVPPYDEQDIGFTAGGDLDEAAIVAFGGSDELRVSAWYDQSGQSRHATQINPNLQPQIYTGTALRTINSKPAIYCNGFGTLLYSATYAQPYSYTAVGRAGSFDRMLGNNQQWYQESSNTKILNIDVDGGNDFRDDQVNIFGVGNGSSSLGKVAASTVQPAAVSLTYTLDFVFSVIGGRYSTSGNNSGELQELIFWPSDQETAGNRTGIETNINTYYDVYTIYNPDPATSGFLFDYPDASTAYSVRQLNNNATVSMRVRRAVAPFDEQDIGFVNGDLDEAAIVAFGGNDALRVSAWYDQSGNQNHARQIAPNSQPQIYNGTAVITENGKPALDTSAGGELLYSSYSVSSSSTYTFQTVSNITAADGTWSLFSDTTLNVRIPRAEQGNNNTNFHPGFTSNGFYKNGASVSVTTRDTVYSTFVDGQLLFGFIGSPTSNHTMQGVLGVAVGDPDHEAEGKHQEVIVWPTDQDSEGNLNGIEDNIMTYYQIP